MKKTDFPATLWSHEPRIPPSAFVAPGAHVMGAVTMGEQSSVWYTSVLRADINHITIGDRTNIQDGTIIHLENDLGCHVGHDVTVGHRAILHGCTIENGVLIGMGAIILNGAVIGKGSVVGAGAVVKERAIIPPHSLVVGVPARIVRTLDPSSYDTNVAWAAKYVALTALHRARLEG